jgi:DMSO/TMAO reductase YedYZ heme-binding membrane subunit
MTWTTATASVVVGLVLSSRAVRSRTGPWLLDLHRFLGGISVVFLLAHLGTLWADSYVEFGPRELFVPGASEWRPEAIAWGIIAAYLLIAVEVSSLLRSRISKRLWRVIHFLSFAAMLGGSYHAWLAGSDVKNPVTWAIAGIGSLLVLGLISMRLQRKDPDDPGPTGLSDNRAILEEMRRRLEELPVPESTPQPRISVTPNPALPRRAPVSDDLPGIEQVPTAPLGAETVGFDDDPFAAVPLPTREPQVGDWAEPSAAEPFGAAAATSPRHLRRPMARRGPTTAPISSRISLPTPSKPSA